MTLYELSLEYEQTAAMLRGRISELERVLRETGDGPRRIQLDRRLRPLRSMYRDVREVARHLNGYYRKFTPGGGAARWITEGGNAMRTVSYENGFGLADLRVYTELMADDNRDQINRLKRNLTHALRQDVTPRQREYMILYYGRNMSMEAIAKELGVNKSTVSRTLKRGRQRLYRCLRYGAANLLEQAGG